MLTEIIQIMHRIGRITEEELRSRQRMKDLDGSVFLECGLDCGARFVGRQEDSAGIVHT
jgi:hypothetical protein